MSWSNEVWLQKKDNFSSFLKVINKRINSKDLDVNIEKMDSFNLPQCFLAFSTVKGLMTDFDKNYIELCDNYGIKPDAITDSEKDKLKRYLELFTQTY